MRQSVVVIYDPVINALHFTATDLQGTNLWFPLLGATMFNLVEQLLVVNRLAHNVARIDLLRQCGRCVEYQVIYNEVEKP